MKASMRCQKYTNILMENHLAALDNISAGNAEVVASMLAGAVCYAENNAGVECPEGSQVGLLAVTVEALQEYPSKGLVTIGPGMPFTLKNVLAAVAVTRYRECVHVALGGGQTPDTGGEIRVPLSVPDNKKSRSFPMISFLISKARKMFRKVALSLRISLISREDS